MNENKLRYPSNLSVIAVIVNYNKPFETLRCIKAIQENSYQTSSIIVVDNASTDNSAAVLQTQIDSIKLLINPKNNGGSGGFNTGIQQALKEKPDYIWLLDDDAYPDTQYLKWALETFVQNPQAGIVGAQLLDIDNPKMIVELGAYIRWDHIGFEPVARGQRKIDQHYTLSIDYVPACCMVISRTVLEQVGLLKECYFIHWDDIEMGYRVNSHGFSVLVNTCAIAFHQNSGKPVPPNIRYYDIRNSLYFYLVDAKHFGMKLKVIGRDIFWRFIKWPFTNNPLEVYILFKAVTDLLRGKMGQLDHSDIWCYQLNQQHSLILSSHLPLPERMVLANNLKMQHCQFEVLVNNSNDEKLLKSQFLVHRIGNNWFEDVKFILNSFFRRKILVSTGYYNPLDILFRRRCYYDGQCFLKKPLSVRILFSLLLGQKNRRKLKR